MDIKFKVKELIHIPLAELKPFQGELKSLSEENFNKLRNEILDDGFNFAFHIWKSDKCYFILDGHQRHYVLTQLKKQGYNINLVPCNIVEAESIEDAKRKVLQAVSQYGKLTNEGYIGFVDGLDLDFTNFDLPDFTPPDLPGLDSHDSEPNEKDLDNEYTKKIKSPLYEPTGEKPSINELVDNEKTNELIKKINESEINEEIKDFLIFAAHRHRVFNYAKIAEYYAHAPKEVQELMENSALIIIDFNKAIENGFVKLSEDLAGVYNNG